MEQDVVIRLTDVSKKYKLFQSKKDRMKEALHPLKKRYHKEFYALSTIDLSIRRGEILGVVGMNGSGKSTLLKIISGIIQPTTGSVEVHGNVVPLLELGSGFNPDFTGLENIYFYNSIMGFSRKQTDAIIDKILDFAEIGDFIHQPLKTYSSGMKARLAFAVSVNIDPEILIVDEVLSVGDELFRRKSFARIEDFFRTGKTILFVSHSIQSINQLCTRAIMLNHGHIVLEGPPKFITRNYQKFIFSKPDQKAVMLNEFKTITDTGGIQEEPMAEIPEGRVISGAVSSMDLAKPFMVNNFFPKSTVITRNLDILVTDMRIETLKGEEVNHLVSGEEYIISCMVSFGEDAGNINLGLAINTEQGVSVTWRFYPTCHGFIQREYLNGDTLTTKWKFTCTLIPETYFIGLTIRRFMDETNEVVFRGSDIYVFKVLGNPDSDRGGYFDAGFEIEIE